MGTQATGHANLKYPRKFCVMICLLILLPTGVVYAWSAADGGTHEIMTEEALRLVSIPFSSVHKSEITYGSKEEDKPIWEAPFRHHHYNPITGLPANAPDWLGFTDERTAPYHASLRWADMKQRFIDNDRSGAFEYLGRVSHLLQDMSVPPHTHAPRGHGQWYNGIWESDLEDYWKFQSQTASGIYTPSYNIPSSPTWGSKMDPADWTMMRTHVNASSRSDTLADYNKVMALISYYHNAFYGTIERENPPLPNNSDPMSRMFYNRMEYHWLGNSWEISGVGEYHAELHFDDWWPEEGELGTVVGDNGDATGYFYFYTTYNEAHDTGDPGTAYPDLWPNGDSNPSQKTLAEYLGEVLIPVAIKYNRGLLNVANRKLTVQSSPSSVAIQLSRYDNIGNQNGTTSFDRYFVSGESVTLTAPKKASGWDFDKWLKNGEDYSSSRSITISADEDTYKSVYISTTWYRDADGDGYGDLSDSVQSPTQPSGYVSNSSDCDDSDSSIHPGATEVCDGEDNNCNDQIDEGGVCNTWYRDADGDGYGNLNDSVQSPTQPPGYVSDNTDCDDNDASINPGATEVCGDGKDNDCDGQIDSVDPDCSSIYANVVWDKTYGANRARWLHSAIEASTGDFIFVGGTYENGYTSDWTMLQGKANSNGDFDHDWDRIHRGVGFFIREDYNGNFLISGAAMDSSLGRFGTYFIKTDSSNTVLWEQRYGAGLLHSFESVSGGYLLLNFNSDKLVVIRTDSSGTKLWEKEVVSGVQDIDYYTITSIGSGNYMIAGFKDSNLYTYKIDSSGNLLQQNTFTGITSDVGYGIATSDGKYIISGYRDSTNDAYLIRLDPSGNKIWEETFTGVKLSYYETGVRPITGGYVITGQYNGDARLIKVAVYTTVPNVLGLSQASAESAITSAGLVVGTITNTYDDTVPGGNVVSQDPTAGASVGASSAVNLVISTGPTIYVNGVNGSDAQGTGSQANPYKTVQKAIQVARDGDTIIIRAGVYRENVTFNKQLRVEAQGGLVRIGK